MLRTAGAAGLAVFAGCTGGDEADPTPPATVTPSPATTPTGSRTPRPDPSFGGSDPERRFDFWAGTWDDRDGGEVTFYRPIGDPLLLDTYGPADAPAALALTFYDPACEHWVRRFLDRRGTLATLSGGLEAGAMVLLGDRIDADGSSTSMRAAWEPVADGAVHHTLETGGAGDDGWVTTFDATYDRTADAIAYPTPTAEPIPDSASAIADRPPRRRFDFWVGEWAVFSGDRQVGESVVERALDGHLVHEHWFGRSGGTGQSFNYYDPAVGAWTQHWVAGNGSWIEMYGGVIDGAMRMRGERVNQFGSAVDYRGTFRPMADGTVEQVLETSPEAGDTWTVGFQGRYEPAA